MPLRYARLFDIRNYWLMAMPRFEMFIEDMLRFDMRTMTDFFHSLRLICLHEPARCDARCLCSVMPEAIVKGARATVAQYTRGSRD